MKVQARCERKRGKVLLCTAMDKYAESNAGSGTRKGLFMMDNLFNMETQKWRNIGPCYRGGNKDPGVLFNFCPWCGADMGVLFRDQEPHAERLAKAGRDEGEES